MTAMRALRRAFLACLWLLPALAAAGAELKSGSFDPPLPAPDFSLQGSDGQPLSLARYRGKVVILGFGYSSCLSVCPTTLAVLAQARRELGEQAGRLQVVYVTVDPGRDDVARLHRYLAAFDPGFVGGTGTEAELAAVRARYGISASRVGSGADYAMAHSSFTLLIDPQGRLRSLMPFGHSAADYAGDVRVLLRP